MPVRRRAKSDGREQQTWVYRTLFPAIVVMLGILSSPAAHADPDPHMPSGPDGYCPGGLSQYDVKGNCMGLPFPDGTRWIDAFYKPTPFAPPMWNRFCSFDRPQTTGEADYAQRQGCARNG